MACNATGLRRRLHAPCCHLTHPSRAPLPTQAWRRCCATTMSSRWCSASGRSWARSWRSALTASTCVGAGWLAGWLTGDGEVCVRACACVVCGGVPLQPGMNSRQLNTCMQTAMHVAQPPLVASPLPCNPQAHHQAQQLFCEQFAPESARPLLAALRRLDAERVARALGGVQARARWLAGLHLPGAPPACLPPGPVD